MFWAEQWVPSGLASVLFASFTLMVVVMAHFAIPNERLTGVSVVGVGLGFVGIATVYAGDLGRFGGQQVTTAAVMAVAALLFERGRPVCLDLASVAALLYLAVLGSAVTFCLYYWLIEHLPVGQVALIGYTTPVVAVVVGALFLAEPVTTRTLVGSALVLVGVALAAHRRHGPPEPLPEP